jgi:hypothetical protein
MGMMVRDKSVLAAQDPAQQVAVLAQALPHGLIAQALAPYQRPGQRHRKLPLHTVLLVVLGMSLYTHTALAVVYRRVVGGLHRRRSAGDAGLAGRSAICQGRARLGVRPLVALFHLVARPLATATTPGAFLWGLGVFAIDGTKEVVPDSPANLRAFGRHKDAAYPQVLGVYLLEVGTHAVVDAGFWPGRTSEHTGRRRVLRSLPFGGSLLLADAGFYSYALLAQVVSERQGQVLARLPASVQLHQAHTLADGTQVGRVYPAKTARQQGHPGVLVRVVTYRLTDPARPHFDEVQRLVTTLCDPDRYLALDLICAYHERWEIELTLDELACHQRPSQQPLRSQTPLGVLQELYGFLLVHYALRALMLEAATRCGVDADRISFARTVQVVTESIPEFQASAPATHRRLRLLLLQDIAACLLPPRELRSNPRVIKRQQSKFPRKRPQHRGIPPLSCTFRDAVTLMPAPDNLTTQLLLTITVLSPTPCFLPI